MRSFRPTLVPAAAQSGPEALHFDFRQLFQGLGFLLQFARLVAGPGFDEVAGRCEADVTAPGGVDVPGERGIHGRARWAVMGDRRADERGTSA